MKKLLASLEAIEAKIAELKKEATPEELKEVEHYLAVAKELERVKGVEKEIDALKNDEILSLLQKRPEFKKFILENPEFIKSKRWVDSLERLAKKEGVKDVELKIEELGKKDPVFEELFKEEPTLVEEFKKNPELFNEYLKDINNGLKEEEEKILSEIKEKFTFEDSVIKNIRDFLQKRPEFKELISKNEDLIKSKHWVESLRKLAEKEN
ncbi:hypothetical protein [Mycoplasmopsis californica]|uniref:hypothetical protein n=1 Tax=Mycoplasmopsis californica TaxID=2113 RepID=UPI0005975F50|nr:hypothetical protein [Mycoplasmopsis californica]